MMNGTFPIFANTGWLMGIYNDAEKNHDIKTKDSNMNIEDFRTFCLSFEGVHEKMPFPKVLDKYSRNVLCFYIGSKWFCYVNIEVFDRCCLKSTSEDAEMLREKYEGIRPAWHMNKRMWNDVYFNSDVPDGIIKELVKKSYDIVFQSLSMKEKKELL